MKNGGFVEWQNAQLGEKEKNKKTKQAWYKRFQCSPFQKLSFLEQGRCSLAQGDRPLVWESAEQAQPVFLPFRHLCPQQPPFPPRSPPVLQDSAAPRCRPESSNFPLYAKAENTLWSSGRCGGQQPLPASLCGRRIRQALWPRWVLGLGRGQRGRGEPPASGLLNGRVMEGLVKTEEGVRVWAEFALTFQSSAGEVSIYLFILEQGICSLSSTMEPPSLALRLQTDFSGHKIRRSFMVDLWIIYRGPGLAS